MKTMGGSYHNLAALAESKFNDARGSSFRSPLGMQAGPASASALSLDSASGRSRLIIVSNILPIRAKKGADGWDWEWDEDALVAQAKEGLPEEYDIVYVGSLSVEVPPSEQETVSIQLKKMFSCTPVFLSPDLKEKYYKGFCKQQLWPLFHYVLPMSPSSAGRFDAELWQAYVKANKAFAEKVVEESATDTDYVWIHDYHLLVLPSLLRKRFNKIRCGVFLHSPFPSSEIFRTFPKREELLRSMLNADLIGFHTFDYARHFLSCCSRMLGLEHETLRGSISLEYYGRNVGLKIMPTGVNPQRLLDGFNWPEFRWRRGELLSQFQGKLVLLGVDDMDVFKGIELKLQAYERLLEQHPEWHGKIVLAQITNAPRSSGKDIAELHEAIRNLVASINAKYGHAGYEPVCYLERHVPLHERIAFYTIADVVCVTATRDGMNLVPYEYVACRQGPEPTAASMSTEGEGAAAAAASTAGGAPSPSGRSSAPGAVPGSAGLDPVDEIGVGPAVPRESMLVVSEFVGCSPSLSGAIRVNPWSIDAVADGLYSAIKTSPEHRRLRHEKHWRYVSQHTVAFWAGSFIADLCRFTKNHVLMKCYGLGLGLDTFRMVALDANFRKLEDAPVMAAFRSSKRRLLFLDYDGTLINNSSISSSPPPDVLAVLEALTADPANAVWIMSGRARTELGEWFAALPNLGIAAEHGFYCRPPGATAWQVLNPVADFSWKAMTLPILKQYQESTDGSWIENKESALVWHYGDADPDFGNWQAKELMDHLEDVLSNKPIQVSGGNTIVEVKPQGVSKGGVIERLLSGGAKGTKMQVPDGAGGTEAMDVSSDGSSNGGVAEFVLCIGDDRSDEDMFLAIEHNANTPQSPAEVFACVVGQKPSKAPNYLNDVTEVLDLLAKMADVVLPSRARSF